MVSRHPETLEVTGDQLIEDIHQLKSIALGVGPVVCDGCGCRLPEGAPVLVMVSRPAVTPAWGVVAITCCDRDPTCDSDHVSNYTRTNLTSSTEFACDLDCAVAGDRGVRTLVVTGRVGRVTDQALQRSWPVLLAPEPVYVSSTEKGTRNLCQLGAGTEGVREVKGSHRESGILGKGSQTRWGQAVGNDVSARSTATARFTGIARPVVYPLNQPRFAPPLMDAEPPFGSGELSHAPIPGGDYEEHSVLDRGLDSSGGID